MCIYIYIYVYILYYIILYYILYYTILYYIILYFVILYYIYYIILYYIILYYIILYYIIFAFCSAKKGLRIEDLDRFGTLFKRSIETVPRRDVENYMVLVLRRLGPLIYAVEVIYRLSLIPLTVCLLSFVGYSNVM